MFSHSGNKVTQGFRITINYFRANFFSQVNLYRSEQGVYKVFILQDLLITFSLKYGKSFPLAHHSIFLKSNEVLPTSNEVLPRYVCHVLSKNSPLEVICTFWNPQLKFQSRHSL